ISGVSNSLRTASIWLASNSGSKSVRCSQSHEGSGHNLVIWPARIDVTIASRLGGLAADDAFPQSTATVSADCLAPAPATASLVQNSAIIDQRWSGSAAVASFGTGRGASCADVRGGSVFDVAELGGCSIRRVVKG